MRIVHLAIAIVISLLRQVASCSKPGNPRPPPPLAPNRTRPKRAKSPLRLLRPLRWQRAPTGLSWPRRRRRGRPSRRSSWRSWRGRSSGRPTRTSSPGRSSHPSSASASRGVLCASERLTTCNPWGNYQVENASGVKWEAKLAVGTFGWVPLPSRVTAS